VTKGHKLRVTLRDPLLLLLKQYWQTMKIDAFNHKYLLEVHEGNAGAFHDVFPSCMKNTSATWYDLCPRVGR
jgi:hypothetical protein